MTKKNKMRIFGLLMCAVMMVSSFAVFAGSDSAYFGERNYSLATIGVVETWGEATTKVLQGTSSPVTTIRLGNSISIGSWVSSGSVVTTTVAGQNLNGSATYGNSIHEVLHESTRLTAYV